MIPLVAALFCLGIIPEARAADMNDTYSHFLLTSSQNLTLELERFRGLSAALEGDPDPFVILGRIDLLGVGGDDPLSYMTSLFAFETWWFGSKTFPVKVHLGWSGLYVSKVKKDKEKFWTKRDDNSYDLLQAFNFPVGGTVGYKQWLHLDAEVSMTVYARKDKAGVDGGKPTIVSHEKEENGVDFDQATVALRSPLLGPYGLIRVDLGRGTPRDFEIGFHKKLKWKRGGVLRLALARRFDYKVTGFFQRNEFDEEDRYTIPGEYAGIAEWKYLKLKDRIFVSAGLAMGNSEVPMRYGFGELLLQTHEQGWMFARLGGAWNRVGEPSDLVMGAALGFEARMMEHFIFRVGLSYKDYDFVDRYGDLGQGGVSAFLSFTAAFWELK
jgi:hypothetical protein